MQTAKLPLCGCLSRCWASKLSIFRCQMVVKLPGCPFYTARWSYALKPYVVIGGGEEG